MAERKFRRGQEMGGDAVYDTLIMYYAVKSLLAGGGPTRRTKTFACSTTCYDEDDLKCQYFCNASKLAKKKPKKPVYWKVWDPCARHGCFNAG